jgi:CRP/FNR family cyclic AMP-dependent transcriptional regulator
MIDTAVIGGLPLFTGLDEEQLRTVARVLIRRRVAKGIPIFAEGDHSSSMYILAAGTVGTSKRLGLAAQAPADTTRQKVLVHLSAPQFFGEMGLLSDLERSATITTEAECELLELTRADFERIAASDPLLGYRLVRNVAVVLAERLRRTDLDVLKLTTALSLALGNR